VDYTDDRLDPRAGLRLEVAQKTPTIEQDFLSQYTVTDYNVTGYIPVRKWDTIALNVFVSDARVTKKGLTDFAALQQVAGLGCDAYPPGPAQDQCKITEAEHLSQQIAANEHGTATSLGGTQHLRAFPNGRFYAGHALFYGAEYRWNLTDERTPFDIFIARGVRTGLQLAFFAEKGGVADDPAELSKHLRSSYGMGFRVVLSGVILRADYATGEEGNVFQLFINYPWGMFSVDNPG
jgi:outer membrane protein assembly factor BamA